MVKKIIFFFSFFRQRFYFENLFNFSYQWIKYILNNINLIFKLKKKKLLFI
jgi:hypothetical protein